MSRDVQVPTKEQAALIAQLGMDADQFGVTGESEDALRLFHRASRNDLTIFKSDAQRRKEQMAGKWR